MRSTYETCRTYIQDRRRSLSRERLYWAIENFVTNDIRDRDF